MFSSVAITVVNLLAQFLPLVSSSDQIGSIITTLAQLIPVVIKEATDLVTPIKNIIASLSSNPASTLDQLAALAALDVQCDAAFEKAAENAGFGPDLDP